MSEMLTTAEVAAIAARLAEAIAPGVFRRVFDHWGQWHAALDMGALLAHADAADARMAADAQRIAALEEALRFYAREETWEVFWDEPTETYVTVAEVDDGETARRVLSAPLAVEGA